MRKLLARFVADEQGATAIEYALIMILVGVAIIASLQAVQVAINGSMTASADGLTTAAN